MPSPLLAVIDGRRAAWRGRGVMRLNADLSNRAVSFADEAEWTASPLAGVQRRLLERGGGEKGRATGVVRYRAGTRFPPRGEPLGEEFLVLQGTFADDEGQYPAGTYVRDPLGATRTSWTEEGCELFVKLRQMHPDDRERVVVDTPSAEWFPGLTRGIAVLPLHAFGSERVSLVRWAPNIRFMLHAHPGGEEIFVLDGAVEDDEGRYVAGSWLRNPPGSQHQPFSLDGCLLYVKIGHLPVVTA